MYDSFSAHLMPLINSSFAPGQAQATVDAFQDPDQRQIAQAELYYFSGRAQECRNIAELYLQDKDLCLRLSAGLFVFFFQSYAGKSICFQDGISKHPGMPSSCRRKLCIRRSYSFLCFCRLSGNGSDASSGRRTSTSQGFSAVSAGGYSCLCDLYPRTQCLFE